MKVATDTSGSVSARGPAPAQGYAGGCHDARPCRSAALDRGAAARPSADEVFLLCEGARITAQSVGSEGLSSRLAGMIEALVANHTRRGKQGELYGRVMRSRR
jgi:hypothetical protein